MSDNRRTDPVLVLIAEHDRLWALDTRETDDEANAIHNDRLSVTKPKTIAGAMAQLEFAVKWDDPDVAKAVAQGLREMRLVELAEIRTAPVKLAQSFGPCLLAPGIDGDWTVGEWDGEAWFSDTGSKLVPLLWALLPPLSTLSSGRSRSTRSVPLRPRE
jgi:hypothetical protein